MIKIITCFIRETVIVSKKLFNCTALRFTNGHMTMAFSCDFFFYWSSFISVAVNKHFNSQCILASFLQIVIPGCVYYLLDSLYCIFAVYYLPF